MTAATWVTGNQPDPDRQRRLARQLRSRIHRRPRAGQHHRQRQDFHLSCRIPGNTPSKPGYCRPTSARKTPTSSVIPAATPRVTSPSRKTCTTTTPTTASTCSRRRRTAIRSCPAAPTTKKWHRPRLQHVVVNYDPFTGRSIWVNGTQVQNIPTRSRSRPRSPTSGTTLSPSYSATRLRVTGPGADRSVSPRLHDQVLTQPQITAELRCRRRPEDLHAVLHRTSSR